MVESRCGAVAVGRTYLLPPLSFSGASLARPWLCFHIPLIEPDVQISRIRLSDKTSRLRPRLAAPTRGQAYETVMPVEVREWIRPAPASPDLVLEAQPPAQRPVQLAHQHCGLLPCPASDRQLMDRLDHAPDAFLRWPERQAGLAGS